MTFDELIKKLKKHLSPKPSEIAQRYRFHRRERAAGESVTMYMAELCCMAELRRLTIHCEFVDSLNKTLRGKICVWIKAGTHSEEASR